jgi:hypothetical protein|tara:strand:- start:400 stop:627 length:228 start_codon:yes stop_codon:yes gene_type:complete
MKWLIVMTLLYADPFAVETLKFDTKEECVKYVMNVDNAQTLAIEVIAKAGFHDRVTSVLCLPEQNNTLIKRKYNG